MSDRLAGTRAVITGASRGIGRAMAIACAAEGAEVVVIARNGELLAELVAENRRRRWPRDVADLRRHGPGAGGRRPRRWWPTVRWTS